jgi:hypothetical protein
MARLASTREGGERNNRRSGVVTKPKGANFDTECPLPHIEPVQTPSTLAIEDESQRDPNVVPVATVIVNRRSHERACRAAVARNTSGRRRFVDPTTSERDYSTAELEFMQAIQTYKQKSGRMFPTWSEVLEVLQSLGYQKLAADGG